MRRGKSGDEARRARAAQSATRLEKERRRLHRLERLYGVLLRAYPREFRAELGSSMREAFRDRMRSVQRRKGAKGLWVVLPRVVADAVWNGWAERWSTRRGGRGRNPRRQRSGHAMESLGVNLRQVVRRLRSAPAFVLATAGTVALGIAAFASVFAVVHGVLLAPLPYRDAGHLQWIWRNYTWMGFPRGWLGGPDIAELRKHNDVFASVVEFRSGRGTLTSADGTAPEDVRMLLASDEFFRTLGVSPLLGRGFEDGEDDPDAASVVVLGYDLWKRRYGGDPGIVGRDVLLNGQPSTVIGVMRRDFHFVKHGSLEGPSAADLYTTDRVRLADLSPGGSFAGLARVRPGVPPAAVSSALAAVSRDLDQRYFGHRGLQLWSVDLKQDLVASVRPVLRALLVAAVFLLLALCANLATLLFGRAAERTREIAVRRALGSSWLDTVSLVVQESVLVTALGGVLGIGLAYWGTSAVVRLAPASLPRRENVGLDAPVVLVALVVVLMVGVLAALPAAVRAARQPTERALRETTAGAGGGAAAGRTRRLLVVAQVALSLVLLVGAGLVARSFASLLRTDPGYATRGALTFRVSTSPQSYPTPAAVRQFHARLLHRLAALPGVTAVGATSALPLASSTSQTGASFPGASGNAGDGESDNPLVDRFMVTPGYFRALGVRLLEGRAFDERDTPSSAPVAIIDASLAHRFFPDGSAVGHTVLMNLDTLEIVGVIRQARFYTIQADDRGQVYRPQSQRVGGALYYVLRTNGPPLAWAGRVRSVVQSIDAGVAVADLRPMRAIVAASLGPERLSLSLLVGFGVCALLLATLGIYGVVTSTVVRRTHEVGIHLALGADRARVLALVLREGVAATLVGLALGLLGAAFTSRLLGGLLFQLTPTDPLTYAAVAAGLLAVALLAAWLPARRATRIPPVEALRVE